MFFEIDEQLAKLESAKEDYSSIIDSSEEKSKSQFVESTYSVLKLNLQTVSKNLEQMKVEVDGNKDQLHEKELEIVETKISTFYITLKEKVMQSHSIYQSWKLVSTNKVKRQIQNLDSTGSLSNDQIDNMIDEDPAVLQKMISQQVFGKASGQIQNAARDISEKCEGIKRLQRNVRELLDMLKEISQIVAIQGEKISSIAMHVNQAKQYTGKAVQNLQQAKKHQTASRSVI